MTAPIDILVNLLDLEPLEVNIYRGRNRDLGTGRVYGGQVFAQALVAARRTVDDASRVAHSAHGYFILPGDLNAPIVYFVDRLRDGRSFTTRRVTAIQHGQAIFNLSASFHVREEGPAHQSPMPDVPDPETITPELDADSRAGRQRFPSRCVPCSRRTGRSTCGRWNRRDDEARQHACGARGSGPSARFPTTSRFIRRSSRMRRTTGSSSRRCSRTASGTATPGLQLASLDHSLWMHRPFRADEWLLYTTDSPVTHGARGFVRGTIHTRSGELVASVAQEGLIRLTKGKA